MTTKLDTLAKKCLSRLAVKPIFPYKTVEINELKEDDAGGLIILLVDGRKFTINEPANMAAKADKLAKLEAKHKDK